MNIKNFKIPLMATGKPALSTPLTVASLLTYPIHWVVFVALYGLSWPYRGIVQLRLLLYRCGILKQVSLPRPVISIGNITTGGTGKTPMVIYVARLLHKHGQHMAILSRGYRRKGKTAAPVIVRPDNEDIDVHIVGDEPLLIARSLDWGHRRAKHQQHQSAPHIRRKRRERRRRQSAKRWKQQPGLPDAVVIVGSKRAVSGKLALEEYVPDVVLLDDGFQHVQLARSCDMVLIDATHPFGGGYVLPAGLLREPLHNLRRAHAFVITRSDEVEDITPIENRLRALKPDVPIFTARHAFESIRDAATSKKLTFTSFSGKRLLAVSGLANPASFQRVLDGLGLPVEHILVFPDHHWFTEHDIEQIGDTIATHQLDAIITTEKDEIRLGLFAERLDVPIYTLAIAMQVQPAQEFEEFVLRMAAGKNSKD